MSRDDLNYFYFEFLYCCFEITVRSISTLSLMNVVFHLSCIYLNTFDDVTHIDVNASSMLF